MFQGINAKREKKKKKREIEGFTGVRCSNNGCSRKVAGPLSLTLPLEVAVHGVVTVGPNGVGLETRPVLVDEKCRSFVWGDSENQQKILIEIG